MDLVNNIDLFISCKGRNKLYRRSPKLFKGVLTLFETTICDCNLDKKDKIKFIQQFFNWFYKSPISFNIEPILKYGKKGKIIESDFIYINASAKFIFVKKLFSILNLKIIDEKKIKKRKYTVLFIFYISDMQKSTNEILLDINSDKYGVIKVFVVLNSYYIKDLMQLIFYYYKNLIL
jgi:hypothetical protein